MNHGYSDIIDRIAEQPKWWDEHAVPRYCDFSPRETANIYANEVALAEVECQGCGRPFLVCFSRSAWETSESARALASFVRSQDLHYGDPPNVSCCPAGPTMNSIPRRVVEFWKRGKDDQRFEWIRDPELEVAIVAEWAR